MKPLSHLIKKSGLIVTTLACLCTASAEPLRFVSWNAQSFTNVADRSSTIEARINSAGFHLKSQNPDVVFLQGLPDWNSAQELSKQLGAEFKVVVCSTFADSSSGEVAILSKLESGLGWPLSWDAVDGTTPSGGIAYATLRSDDQWIAVHSVDFPDTVTAKNEREGAMRQLLASIAGTMEWRTNRPSAFLVGGTLNTDVEESARSGEATLELTSDAGFTSAFLELSKPERMTLRGRTEYAATTADYIFADAGGFLTAAEVFPSIISDHAMISVEWDINEAMPVPQPLISLADTSNQLFGMELRWWVAGLGFFVVLMMLVLLFRRPQRAFDPAHALPSSSGENILFLKEDETDAKSQTEGNPLLTNKERKKLRPHMLNWLKEHFVGSLVSQRQEMMSAQRSAAEQADALGKRVEKMQGLLLTRIDTAEGRVSELESELALAKSENRELIQANLLLAQRELEEARRKMQAAQG